MSGSSFAILLCSVSPQTQLLHLCMNSLILYVLCIIIDFKSIKSEAITSVTVLYQVMRVWCFARKKSSNSFYSFCIYGTRIVRAFFECMYALGSFCFFRESMPSFHNQPARFPRWHSTRTPSHNWICIQETIWKWCSQLVLHPISCHPTFLQFDGAPSLNSHLTSICLINWRWTWIQCRGMTAVVLAVCFISPCFPQFVLPRVSWIIECLSTHLECKLIYAMIYIVIAEKFYEENFFFHRSLNLRNGGIFFAKINGNHIIYHICYSCEGS